MNRVDIVGNGKRGTEEEILFLREKVKPYTREQMEELEKNTFHSPWTDHKKYNGQNFKVIFEHFDDDTREKFGNEYSAAWIDEKGNICSDRYFDIQFDDGNIITAEIEEINNYYYDTKQAM
jgi:hypothetical protein